MDRKQMMRLTAILASLIVMTPAARAQLTVNVNSDIPAMINQAQTMAQWGNQYQQMVQQITHLKNQYEALTGNRGLGRILNNPALRTYLPDQWAPIYDQVRRGQLQGVSSMASSVYTAESFDPNATGGRKRQLEVLAANKAIAMQAYDASLNRVNNINALMQQADATGDMKAAADLQNRMAAENALIQNEQIRLNLATQLQQAEFKLAEEQRQREFAAKFAR
jgi:type IV secretion system protein VirB5